MTEQRPSGRSRAKLTVRLEHGGTVVSGAETSVPLADFEAGLWMGLTLDRIGTLMVEELSRLYPIEGPPDRPNVEG